MRACAEHRSERAFAELVPRLVDSARENSNFLFGLLCGRVFTDD